MEATDLIQWKPEYAVGVTEIDNQHKELMNFVNSLISHSKKNQPGENTYLIKIINSAIDHVADHFKSEEEVLSKTSYEKLADHKKEHKLITAKLLDIKNETKNDKGDIALYNLTVILKDYFMNHILQYDREAKEYFIMGSK